MFFEHVYERGLAQSSYIVGCQASGTAIVIDPKRDIDTYLAVAEREGLTITAVTETHIHADFLSGARELVAATGAELYLSEEGGEEWKYRFPHTPLHDGDRIEIGKVVLEVMHTPGHTPEHISFVLYDTATGTEPRMIFTGDFLFVGDVGRPDLLEAAAGVVGSREPGAREMWKSLQRLNTLPDSLLVWPGHGAGSACGKSLGAVPVTTLGFERATGWAFRAADEDHFVRELLDGQPEAPTYFAMMKNLNRERSSETVLAAVPEPEAVSPDSVIVAAAESRSGGGMQVVDTRSVEIALRDPIPGALLVPMDQGISTWFGWLLAYDRDISLVSAPEDRETVVRALIRIGLDRIVSWADDEKVTAALESIRETTTPAVPSVSAEKAAALLREGAIVVDVRGKSEYQEDHVDGALQIHLGHLRARAAEIPSDRTLVVHCQGGYRSAIACSVLRGQGFENLVNLGGGFDAWREAFPNETAASRARAAV